jgi:hypothetical protein
MCRLWVWDSGPDKLRIVKISFQNQVIDWVLNVSDISQSASSFHFHYFYIFPLTARIE